MISKDTFQDSERGVSPVVGVILMVAITVILAAIIAAFVMDLGGSMQQNANAGVSIEEDSEAGDVTVRLVSLDNADHVDVSSSDCGGSGGELNTVGNSITVGSCSSGNVVTVTATLDGSENVIRTYTFKGS